MVYKNNMVRLIKSIVSNAFGIEENRICVFKSWDRCLDCEVRFDTDGGWAKSVYEITGANLFSTLLVPVYNEFGEEYLTKYYYVKFPVANIYSEKNSRSGRFC